MPKLVISADAPEAWESWRDAFARVAPDVETISWYDPAHSPSEAQYALVWQSDPCDMARMSHMRAILSVSAGVNQLVNRPDFPVGVPLVRMGGEETAALMADYILWATIGLLRDARRWALQQQTHIWARNVAFRTTEGARIGILGFGHLGSAVAKRLVHAGAEVSAWSRSPHKSEDVQLFSGPSELPAFLTQVETLVNLLPSTAETRHLIDKAFLAKLPTGAGLINVGRGEHVVESDLISALDAEHLSGAVLDVFTMEPLPKESRLWSHPRITITPHVAAEASRDAQAAYVGQAIREIEAGQTPPLLYHPDRGY